MILPSVSDRFYLSMMQNLSFRPATHADLAAIVRMLADDALGATREDASLPLDPRYSAAFASIDSDRNQLLAVVERDGALVGCLQLTFVPGLSHRGALRGQIESVRVVSDSRGSGIGHAMIAWAVGECQRRGCVIVQLSTSKSRVDAQRFYVSLGFKASHEGMKLDL